MSLSDLTADLLAQLVESVSYVFVRPYSWTVSSLLTSLQCMSLSDHTIIGLLARLVESLRYVFVRTYSWSVSSVESAAYEFVSPYSWFVSSVG